MIKVNGGVDVGLGLQNQSARHPLNDYTLHFKGAVLMQETAYLSSRALSTFLCVCVCVFKKYLALAFYLVKTAFGRRKDTGTKKKERRNRKGESIIES